MFVDSTINEKTSEIEKINKIFINKSVNIHFKFFRINKQFINNVSKFDVVFINDNIIVDFENFEFNKKYH